MEIEGHPTQDLVEELERRGALRAGGARTGPDAEALRFIGDREGSSTGFWLFVPDETFMTGLDELPS
jgi:hypothetical protein